MKKKKMKKKGKKKNWAITYNMRIDLTEIVPFSFSTVGT